MGTEKTGERMLAFVLRSSVLIPCFVFFCFFTKVQVLIFVVEKKNQEL